MVKKFTRIRLINKKTKKATPISAKKMARVKQLSDLAEAIENLYDRLEDEKSDFFEDFRDACFNCRRRELRRLFGQSTFRDFHGFIRCHSLRRRHPDNGHRRFFHCCVFYFWVDDYLVSIDFCFERKNNNH